MTKTCRKCGCTLTFSFVHSTYFCPNCRTYLTKQHRGKRKSAPVKVGRDRSSPKF